MLTDRSFYSLAPIPLPNPDLRHGAKEWGQRNKYIRFIPESHSSRCSGQAGSDFLRCLRYLLFKDPGSRIQQEETEVTETGTKFGRRPPLLANKGVSPMGKERELAENAPQLNLDSAARTRQ